ncbi:MAG: amidohydrolase family protein, partial [Bacteroidota bacterium]
TATAQPDLPPPDARGDLLIRGATVLTVINGTLENTDVLVRDGKIAEIGTGLEAPRSVRVIDAAGQFLMPGIIDAHSHLGISSVNEWTAPVTAEVDVGDVVDPLDLGIYRALAGGVTVSHAMHGSANVIGGQNETLKHRWGTFDPEALKMEGAPPTIKFALGENPIRVHGRGRDIRPLSRMGIEQVFRSAFTEAEHYAEARAAYLASVEEGQPTTHVPFDDRLEALAGVLAGDILIHTHSYRADEILMLMDVLADFGVERITFQHVNEGFKVAPELAEFGAGASIFSDWYAYKFEVYYSTAYNAAVLTRNGVRTSINSDSRELIRHLYHEAAKAQRYGGLTDDEALALITINPAWQLGIDDRIGSIEVGKDADLALFDGHPLSIYAIPTHTIVDGVVRFDRDADPDDMRLAIDPATPVDEVTLHDSSHHHHFHLLPSGLVVHSESCLAGVEMTRR